jgi:HK97 family phage major capsid protein
MVDLETAVAEDNALMGNLAYLTTPGIKGALKKAVKESGQASYVFEGDNSINGYNAYVSSSMPSALTKGTSSDCHAIVFGNFSELIIAQWAGVDIVVDPYSLSKNAKIQLVVNAWYDIAVRHAASFAAMKDALVA